MSRLIFSVAASLALLITIGCSSSQATNPTLVKGPGVQLSIPAGWSDAAPSAKLMLTASAKSEYVVGVQSRAALDGFTPNFNVFATGPHLVDWAAGDGTSEPTVREIAGYSRVQISRVDGFEVTLLSESRIAAEPAAEFAFTRTVERCSCVVRQTSITVAHSGMVYTGIFTAADKSSKSMSPILANLRASWRWSGQTGSASPVPSATGWYTASDVLLTLADLPDAFRPVDGFASLDVPGGGSNLFNARSPSRAVLTQAVVWPDVGKAETYRALRANPIANLEIGELTIATDAKALLPESRMFGGVGQDKGKSFEWFRVVWRDGLTVSEVASQSAPGAFTQSDIIGLALKQAAHTRFAAALAAGSSTSAGSAESQSAGQSASSTKSIQPAVGPAQEVGERIPLELAVHISPPQRAHYATDPPTSGEHYSLRGKAPVDWGFYEHALGPEYWVHNLEHGGIAILYSCSLTTSGSGTTLTQGGSGSCRDDQRKISHFASAAPKDALFDEVKIVATEYAVPGHRFAIVAWGWRLFMDTWNDALAERFYEAHVDNGPELIP